MAATEADQGSSEALVATYRQIHRVRELGLHVIKRATVFNAGGRCLKRHEEGHCDVRRYRDRGFSRSVLTH